MQRSAKSQHYIYNGIPQRGQLIWPDRLCSAPNWRRDLSRRLATRRDDQRHKITTKSIKEKCVMKLFSGFRYAATFVFTFLCCLPLRHLRSLKLALIILTNLQPPTRIRLQQRSRRMEPTKCTRQPAAPRRNGRWPARGSLRRPQAQRTVEQVLRMERIQRGARRNRQ